MTIQCACRLNHRNRHQRTARRTFSLPSRQQYTTGRVTRRSRASIQPLRTRSHAPDRNTCMRRRIRGPNLIQRGHGGMGIVVEEVHPPAKVSAVEPETPVRICKSDASVYSCRLSDETQSSDDQPSLTVVGVCCDGRPNSSDGTSRVVTLLFQGSSASGHFSPVGM